ncbi:MAG: hypothetical protein HAW67_03640 [Endozoicomonadaceae bacterium]|nr:hypothetical protein [Endozoicomonadaceae bacterium]
MFKIKIGRKFPKNIQQLYAILNHPDHINYVLDACAKLAKEDGQSACSTFSLTLEKNNAEFICTKLTHKIGFANSHSSQKYRMKQLLREQGKLSVAEFSRMYGLPITISNNLNIKYQYNITFKSIKSAFLATSEQRSLFLFLFYPAAHNRLYLKYAVNQ